MTPEFLSGIVVFGAEWCPKCKVLKGQLDKKGDAYAYVDVDAPGGKELADEHALRTLPAVFFKGKQVPADWRFINDEWKRFEAAQRLEGNPFDAVAQQELAGDAPRLMVHDDLEAAGVAWPAHDMVEAHQARMAQQRMVDLMQRPAVMAEARRQMFQEPIIQMRPATFQGI